MVPIDQSEGMVREAGGGGIVGDAQRLPLAGGFADVVLAAHFLYHVADIPAAVAELRRIVRPGGTVLVTTNGTQAPRSRPRADRRGGWCREHQEAGTPVPCRQRPRRTSTAEFASIELDAVTSRIVLEDPEPMVRFVDSCEEFYAPGCPGRVADRPRARCVRRPPPRSPNEAASSSTRRAPSSSAGPGEGGTACGTLEPTTSCRSSTCSRELRSIEGLTERSPGTFYRGSKAFAHFHVDPTGLFADLKVDGEFERFRVSTVAERRRVLAAARRSLRV